MRWPNRLDRSWKFEAETMMLGSDWFSQLLEAGVIYRDQECQRRQTYRCFVGAAIARVCS